MLEECKVFPMKIKAKQTKLYAACNVRSAAACMRNPSIYFDPHREPYCIKLP